ncbi:MAG: sugar phosphate nucleotidyltransferase [Chthoniobacteraceae bacterium]
MSKFRKAVIPAAGLGTRHFPASHAVKKELFPVVGPDGIARALMHYHILDLLSTGFEEICLIVQPGDEAVFGAYFAGPDDTYLQRLAKYPALQEQALAMREAVGRITYAVQHTQEGYGHAVFQSKAFAAGEPVLLCLGDHLFRGGQLSCPAQLIAAASARPGLSLSAVNKIGPQELKGFGTIAGKRLAGRPEVIDISLIIEKPAVDVAREKLRVDGLAEDEFLGWFGMHLLAPSIYDVLEEMIHDDVRDGGEFQLTRAQEIQRSREGYAALEITDGRRYDFGIPADFLASLNEFSRPGI